MKNMILIAAYFCVTAIAVGQVKPYSDSSARKNLRILLRAGGNPVALTPIPKKPRKPQKPEPKGSVYDGWRFIGFPPEVRADLDKALLRLKAEAPVHYKMATRQVRSFTWRGGIKQGSYAYPSTGHIIMGNRDYSHSKDRHYFTMVLIHEIQHCNTPGHEYEAAACYAGWYYGNKLKLRSFFTSWSKGLALKRGYSSAKWQGNLSKTIRMNAGASN